MIEYLVNTQLQDKITLLPRSSGIYKFLNREGKVLYIGKAHNLKSRVSSYFSDTHLDRPRIVGMIPLIADINYVETDNDIEALVLESALIKREQPKYNTDAKDDKSYSYLYINIKHDYPTVRIVRQVSKAELKEGKLFGPYPSGGSVRRVFHYLRRIFPFCTSKDPTKPCFDMHIGLCPGPIPSQEYRKNINGIIEFLKGKSNHLIKNVVDEMELASDNQEYESAAILRDKVNDLRYLTSKIRVDNMENELEYVQIRRQRAKKRLQSLAKELNINQIHRVECYDISNLQGKFAYGSMAVAIDGINDNSQYRIFKIRGVDIPNDLAMLSEVLRRRIKYLRNELDVSLGQIPTIILIDGGGNQLQAVNDLVPKDIVLLGITKGRKYRRKGGRLLDEFWKIENNEIVQLKLRNTQSLSLLRDEAHRFALLHHRKAKAKGNIKSYLDEIPLVGPKTKKLLKQAFSSKELLRSTSREKLVGIVKNSKIADAIIEYFKAELSQPG